MHPEYTEQKDKLQNCFENFEINNPVCLEICSSKNLGLFVEKYDIFTTSRLLFEIWSPLLLGMEAEEYEKKFEQLEWKTKGPEKVVFVSEAVVADKINLGDLKLNFVPNAGVSVINDQMNKIFMIE